MWGNIPLTQELDALRDVWMDSMSVETGMKMVDARPDRDVRQLCCAVLCCAVLCCAVLCCAVLCCAKIRLFPLRCKGCHDILSRSYTQTSATKSENKN
jgi:hypothetical protein